MYTVLNAMVIVIKVLLQMISAYAHGHESSASNDFSLCSREINGRTHFLSTGKKFNHCLAAFEA